MQPITPFSIGAPGFFGLNLQDSYVDMAPGFALQAQNCVIDKYGRIAARKGWARAHTSNSDLSTSNISCIGELVQNDGTITIVAAGGGFLFTHSGTTLTTLTYGGGGAAPTISANNWQFVQISGVGIFFQRGNDPLIYDPVVSTTTFRRLSEKTGYTGTVQLSNCAISAYGRIWNADTATDKNTVQWSDVLTSHLLTGGTSGTLNLIGVWPKGGDEIVALAAHNNYLYIFGTRQILIYTGASTPSTMSLYDTVSSIGCIARDSVQNTGTDVIFLSDTGVRSLQRTIQEKSQPLRDLSKNIRNEVKDRMNSETAANIKSVYHPVEAFYLITMPTALQTYCFDTRSPLEDGAARVTTWYGTTSTAFLSTKGRKLYMGKAGYIGEYTGYLDDAATYRMTYYTPWLDFGNPIQMSIVKKILAWAIGSNGQAIVFKVGTDFDEVYTSYTATLASNASVSEYNVGEYNIAEYTSGVSFSQISVQAGGVGRVLQFGFEATINNGSLSMQKIDVLTKNGRL